MSRFLGGVSVGVQIGYQIGVVGGGSGDWRRTGLCLRWMWM
ncbi:hypothetical protein Hanom_Chr13g01227881 [Helianthus anomalus]